MPGFACGHAFAVDAAPERAASQALGPCDHVGAVRFVDPAVVGRAARDRIDPLEMAAMIVLVAPAGRSGVARTKVGIGCDARLAARGRRVDVAVSRVVAGLLRDPRARRPHRAPAFEAHARALGRGRVTARRARWRRDAAHGLARIREVAFAVARARRRGRLRRRGWRRGQRRWRGRRRWRGWHRWLQRRGIG